MFIILNNRQEKNIFSTFETFKKEPGEITRGKAMAMVKAYQERTTQSRQGIPLVNSVHFDFGALAKYMLKMVATANATGVRIYFGTYDTTEIRDVEGDIPGQKVKLDLNGYNSVVLVGTRKRGRDIVDILKGPDNKLIDILYQPYNGGISCPPYPEWVCRGQGLLNLVKNPAYIPEQ